MIRLHHVDKYFNRKKKNEIHVINDTSLTFEKKGMVGLLGPSGCGKTTLLNVIGGLDSVQSGDILVNGERITKRTSGRIDEIRNLNVGYIFQNYNLVDEMTVFDNVAIVLKMIGVKSKSEIKTKVNYALQIVGMYRYRNRFADMLSGGERQRVAIARAIVKNPPVIIADEPTGNLDSKNTLEVMNIIKAISRHRLVILVTHEEELANFYCNRIVRIRDGKVISDEANDKGDSLDYRIDNNIYLDDLPHHQSVQPDGYHIDLYSDTEEDLDLKVVVQKGNIYVQTGGETDRVEVVDADSSIELIDGSYREMSQEDFLKHRYDAKKLAHRKPPRYASIIGIWEMIKSGFQKVMDYKILKKILLVGFFLSAAFILYAVSNAAGVSDIQDSKFVTVNKDYLKVVNKHVKVKDYEQYENLDSVSYVIPGNSVVNLTLPYDEYFQTNGRSGVLTGSLTSVDLLGEDDLIRGRMPKTQGEVVVDRLSIKNAQKSGTAKQAGLSSIKDFLGKKVTAGDEAEFTIVGITDREEPCIYVDPVRFMEVVAGGMSNDQAESINEGWGDMEDMGMYDDGEYDEDGASGQLVDYHNYNFDGGIQPTKDYECLVNSSQSDDMPLGKTIDRKVNGKKLKVIGYYTDKDDSSFLLVNTNTWRYSVIEGQSGVTVYAEDKEAATAELQELGVNVENTYDKAKKKYVKSKRRAMRTALIMAGVVLLISLIEIFLIMRASFLSRVKEVGVFRAIGVKKRDIYKMFAGEIIAITAITGIPGIAFATYIVYQLSKVEMLSGNYLINPAVVLVAFVLTAAFNLIFGLIPVFRTLRKTPAAILARTDVN